MTDQPNKYEPPFYNDSKSFSGTDLYLTAVTVFLTSMIVRTSLIVVTTTHEFVLPDNYMWGLMSLTGIIAGKNCLAKDNTLLYKSRVCSSISDAMRTVFVGPFTAVAQMGRSLTQGFSITRNLFS